MATPRITSWSNLAFVSEEVDSETDKFTYTMCAAVDSVDTVYCCELPLRKADISFDKLTTALQPLPDNEIYPIWPPVSWDTPGLTHFSGPQETLTTLFIKRPKFAFYNVFKRHNVTHLIARLLTGIVLDRYTHTIKDFLEQVLDGLDKMDFVDQLESAIMQLHSLDFAHNDLNPKNIMVEEKTKRPVLIDFGSAKVVGEALGTSRGTADWIPVKFQDYATSRKENDLFALEKMRVWIEMPTF
ncbi:hypothetical protein QBC38DRAFT_532082 [Podospora fimiseda]|uniref:Protein kinase domain-containing protein n=1 Tax=Podospora fimiseda TaxID=252190 RepID=A0AAN7BKA5_9PEZI|nr:hypothetical protein QBC38DRAFT_532082 [Podospora fimiseda]